MDSMILMKKDWEEAYPDKPFILELFNQVKKIVLKSDKELRKLAMKGLLDAKRAVVKLMKDNNSKIIQNEKFFTNSAGVLVNVRSKALPNEIYIVLKHNFFSCK